MILAQLVKAGSPERGLLHVIYSYVQFKVLDGRDFQYLVQSFSDPLDASL